MNPRKESRTDNGEKFAVEFGSVVDVEFGSVVDVEFGSVVDVERKDLERRKKAVNRLI